MATGKAWATIGVIMIGSIAAAYITSRVTTMSILGDMKPIHQESGEVALDKPTAIKLGFTDPPTPIEKADRSPRWYSTHVNFAKPFHSTPLVHTGIRSFDLGKEANARLLVSATEINTKGFTLNIQTWSDSRVYGVGVDWIAYEQ